LDEPETIFLSKVAVTSDICNTELSLASGSRPVRSGALSIAPAPGEEPFEEPSQATKLKNESRDIILIQRDVLIILPRFLYFISHIAKFRWIRDYT
jgi:hypothetical protein